jgi:talin
MPLNPQNLSPAASNLIDAARATGTATAQLLDASGKAAGGTRDTPTFTTMSSAAKSVTTGIQALLNAANGLKPGQKELDEAIEAIQSVCIDCVEENSG